MDVSIGLFRKKTPREHSRVSDHQGALENFCTKRYMPGEMAATPAFLPGESQGRRSLVGCRLWRRTESDTTEAT